CSPFIPHGPSTHVLATAQPASMKLSIWRCGFARPLCARAYDALAGKSPEDEMTDTTEIWVVSLADADQRRIEFAASVPAAAPAYEFFDAHTALSPELVYENGASRATHGRTLRAGELGCYSSHFTLWRWLLESPYKQMVVIEDDVRLDWSFMTFLLQHDFASMHIDYLRLFAKIPPRWRYVATPFLDRYHHLVRSTGYALGTQAYLLTRPAAEKLVRHGAHVRYPIDVFMDRYWQHHVPNLAIYPFPVLEQFQPS